jgi:hypothetical protein
LSQSSYDFLVLKVPFDAQKSMTLKLSPNQIFSHNFQATTTGNEGKLNFNYKAGKYYKGKIAGPGKSMAAASFFSDNIAIVFADEEGNINLEKIKTKDPKVNGKYILYRETDLLVANSFRCGVELEQKSAKNNLNTTQRGSGTNNGNSVCEYFDCDYQMYLDNGMNVTNVLNYCNYALCP